MRELLLLGGAAGLVLAGACGDPTVLTIDTGLPAGGGEVAGGSDGGDDGDSGGDGGSGDDGGSGSGGDGYVTINEFMASNGSTLEDDSGAFPDWIELHNGWSEDVDLSGWTISDDLDEPDKHELPGILLAPGDYLLLFADGDTDQGSEHLSFSLDADGEAIGIYNAEGQPVDRLTYEAQATDVSAARTPDGSTEWILTDAPTPGESNGSGE